MHQDNMPNSPDQRTNTMNRNTSSILKISSVLHTSGLASPTSNHAGKVGFNADDLNSESEFPQ